MTTLWQMPVEDIEQKRAALQQELDVHAEHDITQHGAWESIKSGYQLMIDRYEDELRKRETDAI